MGISIHAPLAGSDIYRARTSEHTSPFQSTPPSRGATKVLDFDQLVCSNFNPRPPRGERPDVLEKSIKSYYFNPRPPRGERPGAEFSLDLWIYFNPRPPRGERPRFVSSGVVALLISIHAPLAGSDRHDQALPA